MTVAGCDQTFTGGRSGARFDTETLFMNPGDIVQLKSGGPALTVLREDGDNVRVLFFADEVGEFREASLPAFALEPVEYEEVPVMGDADLEEDEEEEEDEEDEPRGAKRRKG